MALKLSFFRKLSCLIPTGRGFLCAMMAAAIPIVTAFGAEKAAKASNCAALAKLANPGFVVEKAEIIPAGPAPAADGSGAVDSLGAPIPEHCLVQGMASSVLADWYDQVLRDNGKSISESVRLFLVPGMTHCDGGQATDQFDMLEAIMAWVEEGRAPDRIKATGKAFPGASRPICPYPLVARYKSGDVNKAESFVCAK